MVTRTRVARDGDPRPTPEARNGCLTAAFALLIAIVFSALWLWAFALIFRHACA
jgi:hypothetical protein